MPLNHPATLYKYLAPGLTSVITNGMLRYTPLGAFNDPFEGRPEITSIGTDEEMKAATRAVLPAELQRLYELLPDPVRQLISFAQLEAWATTRALSDPAALRQMQQFAAVAQGTLALGFDKHVGALSLTEVPDSLLMWSHYAVGHTGFVLEFDARHENFHAQKSPDDELRHIRQVYYRGTRPSAPLSQMDAIAMFFVKSDVWSYEREWRMLQALADSDQRLEAEPYPIHLFRFHPQALRSIILGARATAATADVVQNVVESNGEYAHVRVRRAHPHPTHFLLKMDP